MEEISEASDEEIDIADKKIRLIVAEFGEMIESEFEDYTQQQAMTLTAIVLTELVARWMMADNDGKAKVTTAQLNRLNAGVRTIVRHWKEEGLGQ
jgi:hypothetical protein